MTLLEKMSSINYTEIPPSNGLEGLVKCFWHLDKDASPQTPSVERVLPAGCVELLFHFGSRYLSRETATNQFTEIPRFYVLGQSVQHREVKQTGPVEVIGCRFYPWGAFPFFDFSLMALSNKRNPVGRFFQRETERLITRMTNARSKEEAIAVLQAALAAICHGKLAEVDYMRRAISIIIETGGNMASKQLAERLGITTRQLERKFSARIGISPNAFSQIVRLQNFLKKKIDQPELSLTHLAYECGYADQSHLCRDFKKFTGLTPSEYFSNYGYVKATHRYLAMRLF